MKVVLAHDHMIYKCNERFYSNGGFSYEILSRYLVNFEKLTFLSRQKELLTENPQLTEASGKNVDFVEIPNFRKINNFNQVLIARRKIIEEIKKTDYVIARLPSSIGKLAVKYAIKYKKPYLIEVVGCAWDANINHGSLIGKLVAPIEFVTNREKIRESNYTIYITKEFLQRRYPTKGKSIVCPNVNIDFVSNEVLESRKNRIIKNKSLIKFGLIGSLDVEYKGHDTVIKALGLIKKELPDFKVEFLGRGDKVKWQKIIEQNDLIDNISFVGTVPGGVEVYKWLDQIDIILQPSYAEAQGRSIIEAMSRACPVISSNVGGIGELISKDWLILPGDYKDLAKKVVSMISEKDNQIYESQKNYYNSQQYYKENIDQERKKFLEKFIIESEEQKST